MKRSRVSASPNPVVLGREAALTLRTLPRDVQLHIFGYFGLCEIGTAFLVSRGIRALVVDYLRCATHVHVASDRAAASPVAELPKRSATERVGMRLLCTHARSLQCLEFTPVVQPSWIRQFWSTRILHEEKVWVAELVLRNRAHFRAILVEFHESLPRVVLAQLAHCPKLRVLPIVYDPTPRLQSSLVRSLLLRIADRCPLLESMSFVHQMALHTLLHMFALRPGTTAF